MDIKEINQRRVNQFLRVRREPPDCTVKGSQRTQRKTQEHKDYFQRFTAIHVQRLAVTSDRLYNLLCISFNFSTGILISLRS